MSAAHSPGRLTAFTQYAEPELRDQVGNLIAVVHRYSEGNARRIAACWNACDGVATEALERAPIDGVLRETVMQRDSLLDACRQAEPVLADLERLLQARAPGFTGLAALQALRDAIAKATG